MGQEPVHTVNGLGGADSDNPDDQAGQHADRVTYTQEENSKIQQRRLVAEREAFSRDTSDDIDRRRLAAAWSAPEWRKLHMAAEMSQAAQALTLAGLRRRHPEADDRELRLRLATLLFGAEIARGLCAPEPEPRESDAA